MINFIDIKVINCFVDILKFNFVTLITFLSLQVLYCCETF